MARRSSKAQTEQTIDFGQWSQYMSEAKARVPMALATSETILLARIHHAAVRGALTSKYADIWHKLVEMYESGKYDEKLVLDSYERIVKAS